MGDFHSILCGVDLAGADWKVCDEPLSAASGAALATAVFLARADGARLHLLCALDLDATAQTLLAAMPPADPTRVDVAARRRLERLVQECASKGVEATAGVSLDAPAVALVEEVGRSGRDLVVVGTRERSAAARNFFGSTALRLLRRAPVAAWVARGDLGERPPTVVAAVDLGDMAPAIVSAAARVAERTGGTLHVVHVVDLGAGGALRSGDAGEELVDVYRRRRRERAESEVPRLVQAFAAGAHAKVHILTGDVNPTLVAKASELGAHVVVMGSVVHSAIGAVLGGLGRTAEHLLSHLRASMLVLKPS